MIDLTNKVALITGAGQGMGRSHALLLAKQGATVVITDVNSDKCQVVLQEVVAAGGAGDAFHLDVSKKSEVDEVFDAVIAQYGRLDILVNNAGIYQSKAALELSEEEWDRTIDINLKGQFLCAQRAAKEMAKNKWGRIINISSVASGQVGVGIAGGLHYTASKGGVIAMTETFAIELAPLGILVNSVAPGAINTPMANMSGASDVPNDMLASTLARVPLKRMGEPKEVSAMVAFLASDEASYITGATFYVDGGWLAN